MKLSEQYLSESTVSKEALKLDLSVHDMIYETPAMNWRYGVPLGNGVVGAMIWGNGLPLHLTLDHSDYFDTRQLENIDPRFNYADLRCLFADGKREDVSEIATARLHEEQHPPPEKISVGSLAIQFPQGQAIQTMRFDLARACLMIQDEPAQTVVDIFSCWEPPVVVFRAPKGFFAEDRIEYVCGQNTPNAQPEHDKHDFVVKHDIADGGRGVVAWRIEDTDQHSILLVTVTHSAEGGDPEVSAKTRLNQAVETGWHTLFQQHTERWDVFWRQSSINVPDRRMETLWLMELYKLAASSRRGYIPPNLQGLWPPHGEKPPWWGEHANNINTQMTYWPVYAANHPELLEPFHDWLFNDQLPEAKKMTKLFYNVDGAKFDAATIHRKGHLLVEYAGCMLWPAVGAWWCQHLWWAASYYQDNVFLKNQAYPFMREALTFYENYLETDSNSVLHVPLTHSPEWREGHADALCRDSTIDLALIRFAATAGARAAEILGLPQDASRWRNLAANLVPYPVSDSPRQSGLQISPGENLTESHRHHSHLTPIFPCGDLNIEGTKEDLDIIKKSFELLELRGTGFWFGFSFPWAACIGARLCKGNYAWRMLDTYIEGFISPNTFNLNGDYKHQGFSSRHYTPSPPYTNEAGTGAAAAIQEMLLQSWGGIIRLFPAMPSHWRDSSFCNLRAEGGILVSAEMRNRRLVKAQFQSESKMRCRVANPDGETWIIQCPNDKSTVQGSVLELDIEPDVRYSLRPQKLDEGKEQTCPAEKEANVFGLKKNWMFPESELPINIHKNNKKGK